MCPGPVHQGSSESERCRVQIKVEISSENSPKHTSVKLPAFVNLKSTMRWRKGSGNFHKRSFNAEKDSLMLRFLNISQCHSGLRCIFSTLKRGINTSSDSFSGQ